jgi:hypothetical protein
MIGFSIFSTASNGHAKDVFSSLCKVWRSVPVLLLSKLFSEEFSRCWRLRAARNNYGHATLPEDPQVVPPGPPLQILDITLELDWLQDVQILPTFVIRSWSPAVTSTPDCEDLMVRSL